MANAASRDPPPPPSDHSTETGPADPHVQTAPDGPPELLFAFANRAFLGTARRAVPPEGIVLGRRAVVFGDAALDDPQLSRRHAEIRNERGRLVLRDLESRNRTFVNGREAVGPQPLAIGDVIRLGGTLLVVAAPRVEQRAVEPDFAGDSGATRIVARAVAAVAAHDNTVLVTGETGVGKEVIASAIHRRSGRPGPLVAINCAALSEGVLASELFGHQRGAFTGAMANREGVFRAAERGTLFLDEIGEMPLSLQAKLLRALEARKIRPVGAEHEIPVNVRVVAATGRDVVAEVLKGSFRSDLYARLAQWTIHIRPLRERRDDLPALVRALLARRNAETRPIDPALAERLLQHRWPLNVRGLFNVLSIAVVAAGPDAPLALLPEVEEALREEDRLAAPPARPAPSSAAEPPEEEPRVPSAEELVAALRRFQGTVAEIARHFGCSRQQLYRWLAAESLDPSRFRGAAPRDPQN